MYEIIAKSDKVKLYFSDCSYSFLLVVRDTDANGRSNDLELVVSAKELRETSGRFEDAKLPQCVKNLLSKYKNVLIIENGL